jgi:hypothetical protein
MVKRKKLKRFFDENRQCEKKENTLSNKHPRVRYYTLRDLQAISRDPDQ